MRKQEVGRWKSRHFQDEERLSQKAGVGHHGVGRPEKGRVQYEAGLQRTLMAGAGFQRLLLA